MQGDHLGAQPAPLHPLTQQSPWSPKRLGPLLQGGHLACVHTHTCTHTCLHCSTLILDSHQTPEAEAAWTLLSTPALGTCELPLQPDSPKEADTHLQSVVHRDHLAPEFPSLEHCRNFLFSFSSSWGFTWGEGKEETGELTLIGVTPELSCWARTLSTSSALLAPRQTHSSCDSDIKGQKNVLCIISLSFSGYFHHQDNVYKFTPCFLLLSSFERAHAIFLVILKSENLNISRIKLN